MIQVSQLQKQIKGRSILSDISFEIGRGECVALIGPNGAGKTSLLSCLLGDYFATSGQVLIGGEAPKSKVNCQRVSVLGQENIVPQRLRVKELIAFFQKIYPNPLSMAEIDKWLGFSQEQKNQLTEKLSGGQRRLLAFVLALIGKPEVVFLDEPTASMDTSTRQRFWQIIEQLKADGMTILYSSHYIEEVEHTADRLLVLHQGRLIRDTTPFAMRNEACQKEISLPSRFASQLEELDGLWDCQLKHDRVTFKTTDIESLWPQLEAFGCRISDIDIQSKSLLDSLFDTTKED